MGPRAGGRIRDAAEPFRRVELPPGFDEPRGVFVTLTRTADGALRGCVGFPLPVFPLRAAIPRAAWAAAVDDPRFPPVGLGEIDRLLVELSVLTRPERLGPPSARAGEIEIGRDGLIVEADGTIGLILPQVATEQGWGPERFLSETCRKAGLPASAWQSAEVTVRRFRAELFRELAPGGAVEPHDLQALPGVA